jgi:holo-[acyl-carrier protein] synthase
MLRVGLDLVTVESVREALDLHGDRYLGRVYTEAEVHDCLVGGEPDPERLAARFAAKEAAIKALRVPPDVPSDLRTVELVRAADGSLSIRLAGAVAAWAESEGIRDLAVSVSHERLVVGAVVIALAEPAT